MDILENAKPENCFYCIDGSVLRNILELEQKLRTISNRAFYHHASQSRNDFRNWVRDVFHEHSLANELLQAKTPAEAAAAVRRHIRKAFLAEEEIENAIRGVVEQKPAIRKIAKTAVAAMVKVKKPQRKNKIKNRKLNKKQNKKPSNGSIHGKRGKSVRRSMTFLAKTQVEQGSTVCLRQKAKRGSIKKRNRKGNGGAKVQKAVKKQMRQWLKWLNINPEL